MSPPADIRPGVSKALPINLRTRTASLPRLTEMAGVTIPPRLWTNVSRRYSVFPKPCIEFIDSYAALATR